MNEGADSNTSTIKKDKRPLSNFTHSDVVALVVEFSVLGILVILFSINIFGSPKEVLERTSGPSTAEVDATGTTTHQDSQKNQKVNNVISTKDITERYEALSLQANSVYVWDMKQEKVLYEKNSYQEWPLASITKIMSAVIAKETLPSDALVHVNQKALLAEGNTGLIEGENWSLEDILEVSLVSSSNDATVAIASVAGSLVETSTPQENKEPVKLFVNKMNEKAKELNLESTRFYNPHGLDLTLETSGSYSNARDTAKLLEYAIIKHPDLMESTTRSFTVVHTLENREQSLTNTNHVITKIPSVLASKTGYTDLAGGNLAVAFDVGLNHPIIVVVLGSTHEGRFDDMVKLVNTTIDSFATPHKESLSTISPSL